MVGDDGSIGGMVGGAVGVLEFPTPAGLVVAFPEEAPDAGFKVEAPGCDACVCADAGFWVPWPPAVALEDEDIDAFPTPPAEGSALPGFLAS